MNQYEVNFWTNIALSQQVKIEKYLKNTQISQNSIKNTQKYQKLQNVKKYPRMSFIKYENAGRYWQKNWEGLQNCGIISTRELKYRQKVKNISKLAYKYLGFWPTKETGIMCGGGSS